MINDRSVASLKDVYQAVLDSYDVMDAATGQPVLALKPYLRLGVYHGGAAVSQDHHTGEMIAPTFIAQRLLHKKEKRAVSPSPHGKVIHPPLPVQFIEHARQSQCVYFSLLMSECRRLRWLDIANDLQGLATLFHDEPWHLEMFALAYVYDLLANCSGGFELHAASSHLPEQKQHRLLLLNTYLTQTPKLCNLIDDYVFFAFYNQWYQAPPYTPGAP
ncbi:hypothetical protein JHW33_00330 [Rahnella aceris]|uniref:hypothetical protein n=1 Tax=Rahnella sp. (strain Y9602) TaxID=2703885 RepID=UPI001908AEDF|nr:hypothetical protein [Rahnella aceris]QQN35137.1 hypothetical protein JHW33_00330 [Rahnella aceris]